MIKMYHPNNTELSNCRVWNAPWYHLPPANSVPSVWHLLSLSCPPSTTWLASTVPQLLGQFLRQIFQSLLKLQQQKDASTCASKLRPLSHSAVLSLHP